MIEVLVDGVDHPEGAGAELAGLVCANLGHWHFALVLSGPRGNPLHSPTNWAADA